MRHIEAGKNLESPTETRLTETELIATIRNGDAKAMEYLYDNYSSALFGVIYRIVPDQETAEEILQEVFVKVWQNAASFDATKGRLYTWMLNIARNLSIDKTRSAEFKSGKKTITIENSVHSINKEHSTEFEIDQMDMKQLVERLRPEQKELIDLIYFYGMTQAEAAAKLKIPLGTVKTRVRAAITELRKIFGVQ